MQFVTADKVMGYTILFSAAALLVTAVSVAIWAFLQ